MLGELARSPRNKGRKAAKRLVEIRPLAGYRVPRPIEAVVFSPAIYALLHPETLLPIARQRLSLFVFVQTLLFLERMRIEGVDFLQKNAAIAEEVRRILVDFGRSAEGTEESGEGNRRRCRVNGQVQGAVARVLR